MDIDFDSLEDSAFQPSNEGNAKLLADMDRKKAARQLALPTNDNQIRQMLRDRNEPITLFGERPEDRRDRLRALIAKQRQAAEEDEPLSQDESGDSDSEMEYGEKEEEEFYTEGTLALKAARTKITQFSIPR